MWYVVALYQAAKARYGSNLGLDSVYVMRAGPLRSQARANDAERSVMRGKWLYIGGRKFQLLEAYVVQQHELGAFGLFPRARNLGQYILPGMRDE